MTDVTIPADKAKTIAQYHRDRSNASQHVVSTEAAQWHRETADLLDPQPPTLREQVAEVVSSNAAIRGVGIALGDAIGQGAADAVLAVVADWLAAQPVHDGTAAGLWALEPRLAQRDRDVRLLRGES